MNLDKNIAEYLDGVSGAGGRKPDARYASFDYCFNYFQLFHETGAVDSIAAPENIEISCFHLGFYLASWGMLRGSAELLQKSARHLIPVIELIANADAGLWEIDAHCYTEPNIHLLMEVRDSFHKIYPKISGILFTKIMLGVFGNVPAFDTNFKNGFQASSFGAKALRRISAFYKDNCEAIENSRVPTFDFISGEPTSRKYTRAKIIDMIFFIEGEKQRRNSKI